MAKAAWLFASALAVAVPSFAADTAPTDGGAQPEWSAFVAQGEAAIRRSLIDPDSAKIEWPYLAIDGTLKSLFGKKRYGYWTCGYLNARNRMGGYTGRAPFLIMIRNGVLVSLDIGEADGIDTASATCPDVIKKGLLPPAPDVSASIGTPVIAPPAPVSAPPPGPKVGIQFATVPQGAYIATVSKGGAAEAAGIVPGMTISAINGIPIAGFDQAAIARILQAPAPKLILSIIGKGDVTITKR